VKSPKLNAKLSRRGKTVAMIVGADLVVLLVGWLMLVGPQRSQAQSTANAVNQTQAEIQQAQNAAAIAAAASPSAAPKQQPILTADLYRLAKAMPSDPDMPDLLLELDQVSRAAGVTVNSISPQPLQPATGFGIVPIQLTFSGDFYALTDLIYRLRGLVSVRHGALDASGRLFSIGQIALQPAGAKSGKQLNATVSVDAYVYGAGVAPVTTTPTTTSADTSATTTGP
jgi:Tfp pilus assembly protein PilO